MNKAFYLSESVRLHTELETAKAEVARITEAIAANIRALNNLPPEGPGPISIGGMSV